MPTSVPKYWLLGGWYPRD